MDEEDLSPPITRRHLIRSTIPLVVAAVTVGSKVVPIGPVTPAVLSDYADWLGLERWRTLTELYGSAEAQRSFGTTALFGAAYDWHGTSAAPSTRAATILSSLGVPLA